MALYFHIVERDDGQWICRHCTHEYDNHATLEQAEHHIRTIAIAQRPASIFIHPLGGDAYHAEDL
jgi:hypothetical protein